MSPRLAQAFALLPEYLGWHVLLSFAALVLGVAISLPLAVAASRSARAKTTFCNGFPVSRRRRSADAILARCTSGSGRVSMIRTVGVGPAGHGGNAVPTPIGSINAAGPRTSNGSAPTIRSTAPSRNAAVAVAISSNPVLIPCATRVPVGPFSTKDGEIVTFR